MSSLVDRDQFKELLDTIQRLEECLQKAKNIVVQYSTYLTDKQINLKEEGTFKERLEKHQQVQDCFDEIVEKRIKITEASNALKPVIEELTKKINKIVKFTGTKEETDTIFNNLIEEILKLKNDQHNLEIANIQRLIKKEYPMGDLIKENEIKQLEQWTNMKCGEMIFHSERDKWCQYSSNFHDKILNRGNLIIIVEVTNSNKFGYFMSKKIENVDEHFNDEKSFLFTLISGQFKSPKKLEQVKQCEGICIDSESSSHLFSIKNVLYIRKENKKQECTCYENKDGYFNYHDKQNVLTGNAPGAKFEVKRFIVIQMN